MKLFCTLDHEKKEIPVDKLDDHDDRNCPHLDVLLLAMKNETEYQKIIQEMRQELCDLRLQNKSLIEKSRQCWCPSAFIRHMNCPVHGSKK